MTTSNSPLFGPIPEGVSLGQAEDSGCMSMLQEQIFPNFAPGRVIVEPDDKGLTRTRETTRTDVFGSPLRWRFCWALQNDDGSGTQRGSTSVRLLLKHLSTHADKISKSYRFRNKYLTDIAVQND
jgi:hypothetical protein